MSNYFSMEAFDYNDIQLVPNKCIIRSRKEVDTSINFGNRTFKIPVAPANMQSVINEELAVWLTKNDYYYIMHRFEPQEKASFIKMMYDKKFFTSISVGIRDDEYDFIDNLAKKNLIPEYITIDVAHGHSDYVIKMIKCIKTKMPSSFLAAGNVATPETVHELENAGADATKVGVGPGRVCITKLKTGFGTGGWQLATLRMYSKVASRPIIADGGIRRNGDIAESIRFGASTVMIDSMLARHEESPGNVIKTNGEVYKQYWGSASEVRKGRHHNVEGKQLLVSYRGSIRDTLKGMQEDLQSVISYAGGKSLQSIRLVDYVVVKSSTMNGDI